MGAVYMAEQQEPVRRKAALKIIKPGMDSRQVIARFEAEQQALAMMDHQNIARVLGAGTTQSGRPYFVMELVHGVPITQFLREDSRPLFRGPWRRPESALLHALNDHHPSDVKGQSCHRRRCPDSRPCSR